MLVQLPLILPIISAILASIAQKVAFIQELPSVILATNALRLILTLLLAMATVNTKTRRVQLRVSLAKLATNAVILTLMEEERHRRVAHLRMMENLITALIPQLALTTVLDKHAPLELTLTRIELMS